MPPICNICENDAKTVVYDNKIKLYQCLHCDHTFTLVDEKYKEKNIYSQEYFEEFHKNWFKNPNYPYFQYIHQAILKHIQKHDFKLLDVGAGRGDLLGYLHKLEPNAQLWGIDGAPCTSTDFKFIQSDFMKAVIHEKFDVVTCLMCIEHVENPDSVVKKIKNTVNPQGLVVILTINSDGMMYKIARCLNRIGIRSGYQRLYSEHHVHHFTNRSLRLLLEKNGFKVVSQLNHNYSLASADFPEANFVVTLLYKSFTAMVFALSSIFKNGISQTLVCLPEKKHDP